MIILIKQVFFTSTTFAQTKLLLATGETSGVYYYAGGKIAQVYNKLKSNSLLSIIPTNGSQDNISNVLLGRTHFALVQEDVLPQVNSEESNDMLLICGLYKEFVNLVVSQGSGIYNIQDLEGKKIYLGKEGSGTKDTISYLLKKSKIESIEDKIKSPNDISDISKAINDYKIHGAFYVIGHPNTKTYKLMQQKVKMRWVPLKKSDFTKLPSAYSQELLDLSVYNVKSYQGQFSTLALSALLVANKNLEDEYAYHMARSIYNEINYLQEEIASLSLKLIEESLKKPQLKVHPGALKFWSQVGLIKATE